ncbi:MAG: topoisomerase DNA-binding C4 zinc finger domain-containing protein [[Actinobacillus] rossii]|uniref:DNA topoisomerase type IA Zn finger domain-containing protein n=1 Tax=[Actinobacillus] rossii TaxID=123820 RepID=A0A380TNY9_9PAST|nr:topoisomerase DNA-binding C4 zinc finger domain-containing protein [[Actinobacillus] rossii]MDY3124642.1 topoisomerase DNA-binding C4 zinc finger domain-containing protein [[Actinobacillus] rossii]SUT88781.1 DNA topoisomerase type IA Zn finger domain-containing protein [[Actinobacillus] rossii]
MNQSLFQHTKRQDICPECGSLLQIRHGKKGLFLGCSAFPKCAYLKPLHANYESKVLKELDAVCPECGKALQLKQGSFGMFIGCSGYPDCHFIFHEEETQHDDNQETIPCPDCAKGELVPRRGRLGKTFYGCNRFPQCKFTLPVKPQIQTCPTCGERWAMLKKDTETHRTFVCLNKKCKCVFEVERV